MQSQTTSYYEVLGIERSSSQEEIRKAYLRCARACHPDKNPDAEAKDRFQNLQKIYTILSNLERKALYDIKGDIDESASIDDRSGAPEITEEDIVAFSVEYLDSDVEKEDLLQNYKQFNGDMKKVFAHQILSDGHFDSHRFMDIIDDAIENDGMRIYRAYEKWRRKIRKTSRVDPAFKIRTSKRKTSENSDELALVAKIRNRGSTYRGFVEDLKSRYIGDEPTGYDEITEEAFLETQAQLIRNEKKSPKKRLQKKSGRVIQKRRTQKPSSKNK